MGRLMKNRDWLLVATPVASTTFVERYVPLPIKRNQYVLGPALKKTYELFESSTAAIPGGVIDEAGWGRHGPPSTNAHRNLLERINRKRDLAGKPRLVSTGYLREETPEEMAERKPEST
jgi:hypothetical protein